MELLDANDPEFGEKLRAALGLKEGEKVELITPQFTRTDGLIVSYFPKTVAEFELLPMLRAENLLKIGCQKWDADRFHTHWLYPHEWYSSIPDGLEIVGLTGEREKFVAGETDNDIRFGALSFGFIQEKHP